MRLNVLITAASRRVGLVRGFQQALHRPGLSGEVMVCDVNPASPAVHLADRAFEVPYSDDPGYFDAVRAICLRHQIGLVVPTIDDEIPRFAAVRDRFDAIGTHGRRLAARHRAGVHRQVGDVPPPARPRAWPRRRRGCRTNCPTTPPFPLFVKPRSGRGSVQAFAARDAVELAFFLRYVSAPVVQEYLDGPEFTLDLLCDFDGRPLSVVPRERVVIRAGVIDRGRTVQDPRLIALALACAEVFRFAGPVNIQCRMVDGSPKVFEINPRFSGGIPLTIAAGADFPAKLVDLALGRHVAPAIGSFRGDLWMSSFEASLFLEPAQLALERCVHGRGGKGEAMISPSRGARPSAVARHDALVILQARMGSSRLPGKVLAPLGGRSLLAQCIERLLAARVGEVLVATTTRPEDEAVVAEAHAAGVAVIRGPVDDVLGRFVAALDGWTGPYVDPRHRRQPVRRLRRPGAAAARARRRRRLRDRGRPAGRRGGRGDARRGAARGRRARRRRRTNASTSRRSSASRSIASPCAARRRRSSCAARRCG